MQAMNEKHSRHQQLIQFCEDLLNEEEQQRFKPALDEFRLGLDNCDHYNRGLRRFCASREEIVIPIVEQVFEARFILNISFDQKNKEGLSAWDYAKKYNKNLSQRLMELTQDENSNLMNSIINMNVFEKPLHESMPQFTDKQTEKISVGVNKFTEYLLENLNNFQDIFDISPEKADEKLKSFSEDVISRLQPNIIQQNKPLSNFREELLVITLEERIRKENKSEEFSVFIDFCKKKEYELAIRHILTCPTEKLAAELIEMVLINREALKIDVNKMTDKNGRTPLHQAALDKKFIIYYMIVGCGGNSFIKDNFGKMAQDYRRENGMSVFNYHNFVPSLFNNPMDPNRVNAFNFQTDNEKRSNKDNCLLF